MLNPLPDSHRLGHAVQRHHVGGCPHIHILILGYPHRGIEGVDHLLFQPLVRLRLFPVEATGILNGLEKGYGDPALQRKSGITNLPLPATISPASGVVGPLAASATIMDFTLSALCPVMTSSSAAGMRTSTSSSRSIAWVLGARFSRAAAWSTCAWVTSKGLMGVESGAATVPTNWIATSLHKTGDLHNRDKWSPDAARYGCNKRPLEPGR